MKIKNFKITWHVWVFPLIAILFSAWFLNRYLDEKGTEIQVLFSDAKSIQPEKTRVYYRGVPVGLVKKITISDDGTRAVCHIALQKTASQFAVEGTQFYLVSPKVGFEGISGLETLISGSYISIEPGKQDNKIKIEFRGELSKVSLDPEENTTVYVLETEHAESIINGDSLFFRGIIVGAIGEVKLGKTSQMILVNINIKNQYAKLIRTNTTFWKKQGIKADLGLFNSKIKINSLDTIMKGGVELATVLKRIDKYYVGNR